MSCLHVKCIPISKNLFPSNIFSFHFYFFFYLFLECDDDNDDDNDDDDDVYDYVNP